MKATNKMQLCRLIYYSKSALHVSDDVFAHHQEHLTLFTVFTVSGSGLATIPLQFFVVFLNSFSQMPEIISIQ
jgi:hypothetical protein